MNEIPSTNTSPLNDKFVSESLPTGWPWRLLIFAIVMFAFSLFMYFGIRFGYRSYLDAQAKDLDKKLETLAQQVSLDKQEQFISFYSQIYNLKTVLEKHKFGSNIFHFLEKNVIPSTYFTNAEMDVAEGSLMVRGTADTFDTLAMQIGVLSRAPEVSKVALQNVSLQNTVVGYELKIMFAPNFLNNQK